MPNTKNTDKDSTLTEKIAGHEGVNTEEIAKDISEQLGKNRTEQSGNKIGQTNSKSKVWVYVGLGVVVLGLLTWWIVGKYF